eukprot:TRINITY_DN70155_c0_g1_i1.p1 TRINITY_DN70155_c0_g1~~TRINITY_DN70155_c0_g1_i1.p1  ORF type:complete len:101 (-),score=4.47 TRINITY_DN70155_c0_g1_i1:213-515(-)
MACRMRLLHAWCCHQKQIRRLQWRCYWKKTCDEKKLCQLGDHRLLDDLNEGSYIYLHLNSIILQAMTIPISILLEARRGVTCTRHVFRRNSVFISTDHNV